MKPRVLNKLKDNLITSVAWNYYNEKDSVTGPILLGTSTGRIFETSIEVDERIFKLDLLSEKAFKLIYSFDNSEGHVIEGLTWFQYPENPGAMVIFVVTKDKMYQFIGKGSFEKVLEKFTINPNFIEIRGDLKINRSDLKFYCEWNNPVYPKALAWLTASGLVMSNLTFKKHLTDFDLENEKIMGNPVHLPYLVDAIPRSMFITQFHYIILYANGIIQATSRISGDIVFESSFHLDHQMSGLAYDPLRNVTFAYSPKNIFEVHIHQEDKDVWEMYLQKKQFQLAEKYCRTDAQKNQVWIEEANYFYSQNRIIQAAKAYGKTSKPFEEVCLKFLRAGYYEAVRLYVKTKLDNLGGKTRGADLKRTIMCTWLTDLYQDKLNALEDGGETETYEIVFNEFKEFLVENTSYLDTRTTFDILNSYGRTKELLFYAELIGDYEKLIEYHILQENYDDAIGILRKLNHSNSKLVYKYGPTLILKSPKRFIDVLISISGHLIEPTKVIPALMRLTELGKDSSEGDHPLRYLYYCVSRLEVKDVSIHNYLLFLYVRSSNETPLLDYLKSHRVHCDLEFALRMCTKYKKYRSSVALLAKMGLFEDAVQLALNHQLIEIATECAENAERHSFELSKFLFQKILKWMVKKDVIQAVEFIQKNASILKFDDMLPLFPDSTPIEVIKAEVCNSLKQFSIDKEDSIADLDDMVQILNKLRDQINEKDSKPFTIPKDKTCDICKFDLQTKYNQFYAYYCSHTFHKSCFMNETKKNMSNSALKRFESLQNKLLRHPNMKDSIQQQIDDSLATECVLCNDAIINNIRKPLPNVNRKDWTI